MNNDDNECYAQIWSFKLMDGILWGIVILSIVLGAWHGIKRAQAQSFNPQPYTTTNTAESEWIAAKTNRTNVKWLGKLIYSQGNMPRDRDVINWVDTPQINVSDEIQIGLRDDGVVVWRKKP